MSLEGAVLSGSMRSQRLGIRAARFVVNMLDGRGHSVTLVDPLEYRLPLLDRMYEEYAPGEAPETLEKLAKLCGRAEAFASSLASTTTESRRH